MWSWSSCCEKFWCICAASWASMAFPQALFRSEGGADDMSPREPTWATKPKHRVHEGQQLAGGH
jgi:hypothetical protein